MQAPAPDFSPRRLTIDEHSSPAETEWFHDVYRRNVVKLDFAPYADAPFVFDSTIRALPDLVVSRTLMSPTVARRQKQMDENALMLSVTLSGGATMLRDGQAAALPPGAASYSRFGADDAQGAFDIRTPTEILAVKLSRRIVEPLLADYENLQRQVLPAGTEAIRLLIDYLSILDTRESISNREAQRLIVNHITDLAALAIGTSREAGEFASARGGRAARLAAVKKDIFENLEQVGLSVAAVAARQGVSPRYIHMLFEDEGTTFSEFVVGQRLQRAHRMLGDPRYAAHTISAIALMVGFGDLSYFNRTFRRRFGMSPSDVRAAARNGS